MATHTADLQIRRRRLEHIHQLMAEISDQQHVVVHQLVTVFRAGYYFFALACLTAGLIGLVQGRPSLAVTWGIAGVALVLLWVGLKVSEKVGTRVIRELREELAKKGPAKDADTAGSR